MQTEQQGRLQVVQRQQEWLRQQEQRVHQARFQSPSCPSGPPLFPPTESLSLVLAQEHLSLAQQRLQLDRVRQEAPSSLPGLPPRAQGPAASSLDGK